LEPSHVGSRDTHYVLSNTADSVTSESLNKETVVLTVVFDVLPVFPGEVANEVTRSYTKYGGL